MPTFSGTQLTHKTRPLCNQGFSCHHFTIAIYPYIIHVPLTLHSWQLMASLIETLHLSYFHFFFPSFFCMHATWSAHLSLRDCLTLIVFCKEYKLSSSSHSFLQPHVASPHLNPNVFFNVLFLDTTSLCSFLNMRGKVSHPCETMAKSVVLYILLQFQMAGGKTKWQLPLGSESSSISFALYKHEDQRTIMLYVVLYGHGT